MAPTLAGRATRCAAHRQATHRATLGAPLWRCVRAAATPSEDAAAPTAAASSEGTVFYAGKAYTPAEWEAAVRSDSVFKPEVANVSAGNVVATAPLSFSDVMGFGGSAPEVVNGRLAMLGVTSAIAAEFVSGEGVLRQWSEEPTGIALTFVLVIAGSLATAFTKRDDKLGPFTPQAELLNGRAAMIGFGALLLLEVIKGSPLI